MIAKKNPGLDLEKKRAALFAMGLLAGGAFTLAAFTYDTPLSAIEDEKNKMAHAEITYQMEEVEEEKAEEIKTEAEKPVDTPDVTEPSVDLAVLPDEKIIVASNSDKKIDSEVGSKNVNYKIGEDDLGLGDLDIEIFEWVDKDAEFVGDELAMARYIQSNVIYPQEALEMGIQGKVHLSFVIEKDGSVTNVHVEKTDDKMLDREAKRVVRSFPKWIPAEVNARKVRAIVRLPIVFLLD